MRKNLLRTRELLPEALTGDPTAQAVLVTLGFGYLVGKAVKALKCKKVGVK